MLNDLIQLQLYWRNQFFKWGCKMCAKRLKRLVTPGPSLSGVSQRLPAISEGGYKSKTSPNALQVWLIDMIPFQGGIPSMISRFTIFQCLFPAFPGKTIWSTRTSSLCQTWRTSPTSWARDLWRDLQEITGEGLHLGRRRGTVPSLNHSYLFSSCLVFRGTLVRTISAW